MKRCLTNVTVAVIALVVCFHVTLTDAKVFERCELAQVLRYGHGVDVNDVANWVCIAQHSSSLNTSAFAGNAKIGTHGIFQISDEYWCSPPGKGVACGVSCDRLRDDDISDDLECVQKIHNEHQGLSGDGFNAWNAYRTYCKDNPYEYIEDCFGNDERELFRSKSITTNYVRDEVEDSYEQPKSRGKVYGRCELAKELFLKHKMPMEEIPTWVCIAQHESSYDTSAVGRLNADGSADHGLFQISDLFWCSKKGGQRKACGQPCSKFLDSDITDDVKCVKQIHKEHTKISGDGFNAWTVYKAHCYGQTDKYIRGCFDGIDAEETKLSEQYKDYAKPIRGNKIKPNGKVYDPCELADDLRNKYQLPEDQIATWVCIAKHESNYNTSAIGYGDHGLFQISDIYWCSPPGKGWACGLSCADLEDSDISDDVKCIRKIYDEHSHLTGDGFNAWTVYPRYCTNGRAEKYISHCPSRNTETLQGAASYNSYSKAISSNSIEEYNPVDKGKVYGRCELANELYDKYHMPMEDIPTWVCIVHHESNFDTSAVGRLNADGSADHGLFQISDLFWCSDAEDDYGKACGLPCSKLLDSDISDDVECVKQIHDEHTRISGNGFNAWTTYNAYCNDRVELYTQGCFDGSASVEDFQPIQKAIDFGFRPKNKPKGKVYDDCELAKELRDKHRIPKDQISSWVCISKRQSGLNTSAVSADSHGMFFISDEFWCSPPGKGKACELHCSDLEDSDITDDLQCVQKIYDEHQKIFGNGFNAWRVYEQYCSNGRADEYVSHCKGFESTSRNSIEGRSIAVNKPVFNHEFNANPFLKHVDMVQKPAATFANPFFNSLSESFIGSVNAESMTHNEYVRNPFLKNLQSTVQKSTTVAHKTTTPATVWKNPFPQTITPAPVWKNLFIQTTTPVPAWKNPFIQTKTVSYPVVNNLNFQSKKPTTPVKSLAWSAPNPTMSEEKAKYEFYKTFTTPAPPAFTVTPRANRLQPYHLNTIKSSFETILTPFWLTTTSPKPTSRGIDPTPFWLASTTPKPTNRFQFINSTTSKALTTIPSWQSWTTSKPTIRPQWYESTSQKSVAATPFWLTTTTQKPTTRVQTSSNVPFWLISTTQKPTSKPFYDSTFQKSLAAISAWQTTTTQKPTTKLQSLSNVTFWVTSTTQKPTTKVTTTQKSTTKFQSSSNMPFWVTSQKPTSKPFYDSTFQKSVAGTPSWLTTTTQKPTTKLQSSSNVPFWMTSTTQNPTAKVITTQKSTTKFQSSSNVPSWLTSQKPTSKPFYDSTLHKSVAGTPSWLTTTTQKPTTRYQSSSSNVPFWVTSLIQKPTEKVTTTQKSTTKFQPFWVNTTTQKPTSKKSKDNTPFWLASTSQKPSTRLQTSTTRKPTSRASTVSTFGAVPFWLASTSTAVPPTDSRLQKYQISTTTKLPTTSKINPLPLPTSKTNLYTPSSTAKTPGQYNAGQYNSGRYNSGKYEAPKSSPTATTKLPSSTSTTKSQWNAKRVVSTSTSKTTNWNSKALSTTTTKYDPFRQFSTTTTRPKTTTTVSKPSNLGFYISYKSPTTITNSSSKTATTKSWNSWSTTKLTTTPMPSTTKNWFQYNSTPTTKSTIKPSYVFSTTPSTKWTTPKPYSFQQSTTTTAKPSLKTTTKQTTQKYSFQYTTPVPKVSASTTRAIANSTTPWTYVAPTRTQKSTTPTLQTIIPPWAITTTTHAPTTTVYSPTTSSTSKNNLYDLYLKLYGNQPTSGTKTA